MKKSIAISLLAGVVLGVSGFSALPSDASPPNGAVVCGHESDDSQLDPKSISDIYDNLHYGITWFSPDVHPDTKRGYCIPGKPEKNPYFNPRKQHTLIFVHGWLPDSVTKKTRFNFDGDDMAGPVGDPNEKYLIAPWLKGSSIGDDTKAWNVGVFYWNQFSDEPIVSEYDLITPVQKAEAKIWSPNTSVGMEWRSSNGNMNAAPDEVKTQSVADLFYKDYVAHMKGYKGDVRLVGQSLGTQLVLAVAQKIDTAVKSGQLPSNFLPKQVVLLDPAVTVGINGDHVPMNNMINAIDQLKADKVIISGYRTSTAGHNTFFKKLEDNTTILQKTAFMDLDPCIYTGGDTTADKATDLLRRHQAGIWWYFLSYKHKVENVPSNMGYTAEPPSAIASEDFLTTLMQGDKKIESDVNKNKGEESACTPYRDHPEELDSEWLKWQVVEAKKTDPQPKD